MTPLRIAIAPILGNQAKRLLFSRNIILRQESVRFKSVRDWLDRKSGGTEGIKDGKNPLLSKSRTEVIKDEKNPWQSMTDDEWRERLTYAEFEVARKKATEIPFTGKYYNHNEEGIYACTCCSQALFSSREKYDSGSGWPSFYSTIPKTGVNESGQVKLKTDTSFGMIRTEVLCAKCNAHLGHLFNDESQPTGLRYCINSISLKFFPKAGVNEGNK